MGNGFDNTNTQQQQQTGANGLNASDAYPPPPQQNTSQPWRQGYGQIAPIYGQVQGADTTIGAPGQQTQNGGQVYEGGVPVTPRPVPQTTYNPAPYNVTPGTDTSQGNGNGGAAYNPGGAAYNPGDQQVPQRQAPLGNNGQSGPVWNQQNPRQDSSTLNNTSYDSAPVVKPIGVFPGAVMGGLGGIVGGSLIPTWGNKAADAILRDGTTAAGGATKPGFFAEGGTAESIFGKKFTGQVSKGVEDLSAKAGNVNLGGVTERAATSWQNQFDPRFQNRPDLQKLLDSNNEALKTFAGKDAATLSAAEQAQLATLNQKQTFLSAGETAATKLNPTLFTAEGKTAIEGLKTATPFTEAEMTLINGQASKLNTAFPAAAASKEVALLERPMVGNFAQGAALVGGSLLADHIASSFIGKDGAGHLSSVALPMAWLAGGTFKERAIYSVAAIVGSKTIDALLPAADHTTINRIMAPNGVDSLTMGAAFLLPAADPRTRMAMVGGAWVFGRERNMNDTESLLTTGGLMGATGLALKVGKINPELGVGLLAAEGGAFVLSRIFKGNTK